MCGIAGIVSFDPARPVDHIPVSAMMAALVHRGPDDQGLHVQGAAGFGFRRLAIVDPRPAGNQPHFSENRRIMSVCNGEIYNHLAVRQDLESRGHHLKSRCDVEILPHLFQELGGALLEKINGQFALAIYDQDQHRLLLARDPVGVCPLFYTQVEGQLLFASEIKALLTHPGVKRRVNLTGLDQILTFPGPVSPVTLFADIQALPPGHALMLEEGRLHEWVYWDLHYPLQAERLVPSDWREQLDHLLRQAVRRRLQADVPVGFYLSGGLDSSLLAGLIHRLRPSDEWRSFSIVFDDPALDERRYQRLVADGVGSRHRETPFSLDEVDRRLRSVIRHAETPLKETYDVCSHLLAESVRSSGCKVVLSGEGADEMFAGYVGYRLDGLRENEGDLTDLLDEEAWAESQLRERLWGDPRFFYERDYHAFHDVRAALYAPDLAARLNQFDCTRHSPVDPALLRGRHPLHQRSYVDFKLRIADHLLADHGDRMTFAHSVEGRYPFLDQDLIEFVAGLPPALMTQDGREKFPLRQVARPYVPAAIIEREKFAFVAPGSPALLSRSWVAALLEPERIRREGYFNPATVARLRSLYLQENFHLNQTFDADLMMVILTFQIFLEEFHLPSCS